MKMKMDPTPPFFHKKPLILDFFTFPSPVALRSVRLGVGKEGDHQQGSYCGLCYEREAHCCEKGRLDTKIRA